MLSFFVGAGNTVIWRQVCMQERKNPPGQKQATLVIVFEEGTFEIGPKKGNRVDVVSM
jgi:hypothetical protein